MPKKIAACPHCGWIPNSPNVVQLCHTDEDGHDIYHGIDIP